MAFFADAALKAATYLIQPEQNAGKSVDQLPQMAMNALSGVPPGATAIPSTPEVQEPNVSFRRASSARPLAADHPWQG
jgi:hypothetical protein